MEGVHIILFFIQVHIILDIEWEHAMLTMAVTGNQWRTVVICVPWTMHGPIMRGPQRRGQGPTAHSDHPRVDSLSASAVPHCDDATTRGPYVKLLAYEMAVRRSGWPHMPAVAGLSQSRGMARAAGAVPSGMSASSLHVVDLGANWNNPNSTILRDMAVLGQF
jgi:hypothetical protein